jgi:hypothetical protein
MIGPITVVARAVLARSNAGIVGSNPTQAMDVCAFILCLRRAPPPSKEAYRLCIDQETEKAAKVQQRAVGL